MKVSLIQSGIVWENPVQNLEHFKEIILRDATGELIILPEMFSTGFSMTPELLAEDMIGNSVKWLKKMSLETKALIAGSLMIRDKERYYNRFVFAHKGEIIHLYDKRHLFAMAGEHKIFSTGHKPASFEFDGWKIRPAICYDLRFPVWTRNTDSYDLLIYTANWPAKRAAHWNALLPARAIENQSYVLAVNRIGLDGNGLEYQGDSGIFSPTGQKMATAENQELCLNFTLDKAFLENCRKELPFLQDADVFQIDF